MVGVSRCIGAFGPYGQNMTEQNEGDRFLTVAEVAGELRISPDTVRRWIKAGTLPAIRLSARDLRVERAQFEQLVAQLRTTSPLALKAGQ